MSFSAWIGARAALPIAVVLPLLAVGCAGLGANDPNLFTQPQAVNGPCTVKKFFLLSLTAVHTEMAVDGTGQACTFTVLNPNLQAFPTASLITQQPAHGHAEAGLVNGGRSPIIAYTPAPGYHGPDRFTATIEPDDHAIAVAVTVR